MKKLAITLLLALTSSLLTISPAQAQYLSEIKYAATGQTALLPATAIVSAGGSGNASRLVCSYLTTPDTVTSSVYAVLRWVDENGDNQSYTFPASSAGSSWGCVPIYHQYSSAPTIETDGTYSESYNLFVIGLGFWNAGPNKEGGITEPLSADYASQTSLLDTDVFTPTSYSTDLAVLTLSGESNSESITASLEWFDDSATWQTASVSIAPGAEAAQIVLPIRLAASHPVVLVTTGTVSTGYDLHLRGAAFGTPTTGAGPLTLGYFALTNWAQSLSGLTGFTIPAGTVAAGIGNLDGLGVTLFGSGQFAKVIPGGYDTTSTVGAFFPSATGMSLTATCEAVGGCDYDVQYMTLDF